MSTENEEDIVEVPAITPTADEEGNDTTDWKALAEERQALAEKNHGIAQRFKTKLEKSKEVKEPKTTPEPKVEPKSNEVDYGLEAYFVAKGIPDEDIDFIHQSMKDTGKEAKDLLGKNWFQAELKERQDARTSEKAIPKGTKRSSSGTQDSVEYHLEKYESGTMKLDEMPFEMRSKVLEKALERKEAAGKFNFSK